MVATLEARTHEAFQTIERQELCVVMKRGIRFTITATRAENREHGVMFGDGI